MRLLYSLLFYLAMPFIGLRLLWRARRNPDYAKRWRERLGEVPENIQPHSIWWHTVSVGETLAAIPLIKTLQQRHPGVPVLITTMTPTGSAQVTARLGDSGVQHMYLPYDLPHVIKRFLKRVQPRLLIIMETELWPNVIHYCHRQKIPVVLTNARLSEKSARGYARFRRLTKNMLKKLTAIAAQSAEDGERFVELGFPRERLTITGSIKWDMTIDKKLMPQAKKLRQQWGKDRPVWIAASTHAGEEEQIIKAHQQIRADLPNVLLLWVPRHPERAKEIQQACQSQSWRIVTRRSAVAPDANTDVFLVDTLGELLLFYASADVAFVGGSLIEKGGHNMLEPAALAKPILSGPSLFNFAEIAQRLILANALLLVEDAEALAKHVLDLLQSPERSALMGKNAEAQLTENRGATEKQLAIIEEISSQKSIP